MSFLTGSDAAFYGLRSLAEIRRIFGCKAASKIRQHGRDDDDCSMGGLMADDDVLVSQPIWTYARTTTAFGRVCCGAGARLEYVYLFEEIYVYNM